MYIPSHLVTTTRAFLSHAISLVGLGDSGEGLLNFVLDYVLPDGSAYGHRKYGNNRDTVDTAHAKLLSDMQFPAIIHTYNCTGSTVQYVNVILRTEYAYRNECLKSHTNPDNATRHCGQAEPMYCYVAQVGELKG